MEAREIVEPIEAEPVENLTEETVEENEEPAFSYAELNLTENGVRVKFENEAGRTTYKTLGLESIARIFNKDQVFDSGFLPLYGSNYIGVKRVIRIGDKQIYLLESCPMNRDTDYKRETIKKVRYPGLIMAVICRSNVDQSVSVTDSRIFATTGPIMRESDALYDFPFGNVYSGNRGSICWGSYSNILHSADTVPKACSLLTTFLDAQMNSDLYQPFIGKGLEDLLQDLSEAKNFPYDGLKKSMTIKELLSLTKSKRVG